MKIVDIKQKRFEKRVKNLSPTELYEIVMGFTCWDFVQAQELAIRRDLNFEAFLSDIGPLGRLSLRDKLK